MSKKLEEKQQRRLAEERKRQEASRAARKRNLVTLGVAVLVAALVVGLIIFERPDAVTSDFGVSAEEAACTDIETHDDEGRGHTEEGTDVQYGTQPPTSGEHSATTADPGFSSEPVAEENAVHNLEHGQIVVWYSPDAPAEVIEQIETYVDGAGLVMLGLPYDDVPSGYNFSITAWTASQHCEDVSGQVLAEFRERFQGKGPEQVGIPLFEGEDA